MATSMRPSWSLAEQESLGGTDERSLNVQTNGSVPSFAEVDEEVEFIRRYVLTPKTLAEHDLLDELQLSIGDMSPMHLQATTVTTLEGEYSARLVHQVPHQQLHHHHSPHKPVWRYPWVTLLLCFITMSSFVYGAYKLDWQVPVGWNLYTSPVPDDPSLPFLVISPWPSCQDMRSEVWRTVSYQLVHGGFFHFFMNQITLLAYGSILEPALQGKALGAPTFWDKAAGGLTIFIAFQAASVLGCLANAYNFGYTSLVGNSGGVYGLVGLGWACLFTRRFSYMHEKSLEKVLLLTLTCQLIFDIISFTALFNAAFGYLVHFSGFVAGLGVGLLATGLHAQSRWWRLAFCLAGISLQVFQWSFLVSSYLENWPPAFHVNPFFDQQYDRHACCLDAYRIASADGVSLSQVRGKYYCDSRQMLQRQ